MNEPITSPEWKQEVENDDRAGLPSRRPPAGIPTLSGRCADGSLMLPEPLMSFDRTFASPFHTLKYKLEMRRWRADVIEDFLDRLGFKPFTAATVNHACGLVRDICANEPRVRALLAQLSREVEGK